MIRLHLELTADNETPHASDTLMQLTLLFTQNHSLTYTSDSQPSFVPELPDVNYLQFCNPKDVGV
jgi:hypothetical protein